MGNKSFAWLLALTLLAAPAGAALTLAYADFDLATGSNDGTSEANAWQSCTDLVAGIAVNDHVYVQQTSAANDEDCTFSTAASATQPIVLEGYLTTPGDGGDSGLDNYFESTGQWVLATGYYIQFFNFEGQPSATSGYLLTSAANSQWTANRVRINNTRTDSTVATVNLDDEGTIYNSIIVSPQGQPAVDIADAGLLYGSVVDMTATSANGVLIEHNALRYQYVINNIIFGTGEAGKAIYSTGIGAVAKSRIVYGNSIYNVAAGIEFKDAAVAGDDVHDLVMNNLIYTVGRGIHNIDEASSAGVTIIGNATGDCSVACYEGWTDNVTSIGAVTLTVNPWNNAPTDFRLNSTAGGGADVQGVALPTDINLDGGDLNAQHMGAVQAVAPAASTRRRGHVIGKAPTPQPERIAARPERCERVRGPR